MQPGRSRVAPKLSLNPFMQDTPFSLADSPMISDQICDLWQVHEPSGEPYELFAAKEAALVQQYRHVWASSLSTPQGGDLNQSLLLELSEIEKIDDLEQVEALCRNAVHQLKETWLEEVNPDKPETVTEFYDRSRAYIFELMWWHNLSEDLSPLGYVSALHLALRHEKRRFLDFGAGVGSGALLFAKHGFDISLADISESLLTFSKNRLDARGIHADYIDLKDSPLPDAAYDFIAAMDVFEHIADPAPTVARLSDSLQPGGILFGRFNSEEDPDRPQHIAGDFQPTFELLKAQGFQEIWRDRWLWGHQAFQKPS